MRRATTIEFRDAVRAAARELGARIGRSYTDKPYAKPVDLNFRYVSFVVQGAKAEKLVRRTEEILAASGVTARTRIGRVYSCYVRGDCSRMETVA